MTPSRPERRAFPIPNSSAVVIVGIEEHEEHEFSVGDVAHRHRLFDVYALPGDRSRCMVEVQCPHCCRLNYVPVTIKRGLPHGPGGRIRCEYCQARAELFTIDPNRGRIQLVSRRHGCTVSVTMADAVRAYRDYRRTVVVLAKEARQQATNDEAPAADTTYTVIPLRGQIAT